MLIRSMLPTLLSVALHGAVAVPLTVVLYQGLSNAPADRSPLAEMGIVVGPGNDPVAPNLPPALAMAAPAPDHHAALRQINDRFWPASARADWRTLAGATPTENRFGPAPQGGFGAPRLIAAAHGTPSDGSSAAPLESAGGSAGVSCASSGCATGAVGEANQAGPAGGSGSAGADGDGLPVARPGNRPPAYPALARRRGQQGTVQVEFDILPAGEVAHVAVLHSSGFAELDRAATAAVTVWKFAPNAKGRTRHAQQRLDFVLEDASLPQ